MLNDKTELVEYLRLHGEDYNFKSEYRKRINEDNKNKLIQDKNVREFKLLEIFND